MNDFTLRSLNKPTAAARSETWGKERVSGTLPEMRAWICGLLVGMGLLGTVGCGGGEAVANAPHGSGSSRASALPQPWEPRATGAQLPGGRECLAWLPRLGIAFRPLDRLAGVATPVEVLGPIAGINYVSAGRTTFTADCRLILALDWAGRSLARVGVDAVRHSGAYVYRTTSSGRPSLHALGLAIDVHAVHAGGIWYEVDRDYQRGAGAVCQSMRPLLNHVYCRLHELNLFRELITPDHNDEHHDHFHLGIAAR